MLCRTKTCKKDTYIYKKYLLPLLLPLHKPTPIAVKEASGMSKDKCRHFQRCDGPATDTMEEKAFALVCSTIDHT